ncbi:hypothetical protein SDC9_87353 [bioreactor metagenome]|uniref:Uncharacterized protein n=1 Tax=bioreactor metagenome TaxID=1076179 RepID=A0A644ZIJ0_9ZZZZ
MDNIIAAAVIIELLQCQIGNDFIDIHVSRGAGTALQSFCDKSFICAARKDMVTCFDNCRINVILANVHLNISKSSCFFHQHNGVDQTHLCFFVLQVEIFGGTRSLNAV